MQISSNWAPGVRSAEGERKSNDGPGLIAQTANGPMTRNIAAQGLHLGPDLPVPLRVVTTPLRTAFESALALIDRWILCIFAIRTNAAGAPEARIAKRRPPALAVGDRTGANLRGLCGMRSALSRQDKARVDTGSD